MSSYEYAQSLLRDWQPIMRYKKGQPFSEWQTTARDKLTELLGLPFEKVDDRLTVEYETKTDLFTEIRFMFQSEKDYYVPCHFLIPNGAVKPLPTVICLQGHTSGMHISLGRPKYSGDDEAIAAGDRDFAIRAVKEGCCALVMEQRGFGERETKKQRMDCHNLSMVSLMMGRTTYGERVWDIQRAIDIIEKHFPQADAENIISLGNSGGGSATYYAACLEDRIKIAVPSCSVCSLYESLGAMRHCDCCYIPGFARYFDIGDLGGLIAPKRLVVVAGREDEGFPIDGVRKAYAVIEEMYKYANAPDNCSLIVGDGGHRFYADLAWNRINEYLMR